MSEIRMSEKGTTPKSELLTVWILACLIFKRSGLKKIWAQAEGLVCTIKTQMNKNQTTFYGHSKMSEIQTKMIGFQTVSEIRTVWE